VRCIRPENSINLIMHEFLQPFMVKKTNIAIVKIKNVI